MIQEYKVSGYIKEGGVVWDVNGSSSAVRQGHRIKFRAGERCANTRTRQQDC